MKKKELETLEKINEERKLNEEAKEKIRKKSLKNFLFATAILIYFIVLIIIARALYKQTAILIYKILSLILLTLTIVLFEVAYKKDNDNIAITSIEMWFLSISTLLTPYTFILKTKVYTSLIGVFFAIYYCIKNIIIYRNEKNKYLKEKNDINQIVKKESKDKLAQEQLEKVQVEKETKTTKKIATTDTKKTTKKTAATNTKNTTKETAKETTKKTTKEVEKNESKTEIDVPKKKRGRPRKIVNNENSL